MSQPDAPSPLPTLPHPADDVDVTDIAAHQRAARDAVDVLRAAHHARGEAELHRAALLWRRQLDGAVSARELYRLLRDHPRPAPVPADVVDAGGQDWLALPAAAEVRIAPAGTHLDVRQGGTPDAPLVYISASPDERTFIDGALVRDGVSDVWFVGLRMGPTARSNAFRLVGSGNARIRLIDCELAGAHTGAVIQAWAHAGEPDPLRDIELLRCIVRHNAPRTADSGHSQGVYIAGVHGLRLVDCIFDANGWSSDVAATIYNHNAYLMHCEQVVVQGNLFSRGASFGLKISSDRAGGFRDLLVRGNLFIENGNGLTIGNSSSSAPLATRGVRLAGNVFTRLGRVIRSQAQSFGVDIFSAGDVAIEGNLWIEKRASWGGHPALWVREGAAVADVAVRGNVVMDWASEAYRLRGDTDAADNQVREAEGAGLPGVDFPGVDFRGVDAYAAAVGLADFEALRSAALQRARGQWPTRLAPAAACAWLLAQQ